MRAKAGDFLTLFWIMVLTAWVPAAQAAIAVKAVRLWPAPEYSRLTLELAADAKFRHFTLKNPHRLVLDLEDVELDATLAAVGDQVHAQEPLIASLRVGRFQPNVIRLVAELKTAGHAKVFTLKPMGDYGHRLVIDIYPEDADARPAQPIQAAVAKVAETAGAAEKRPVAPKAGDYVRLLTIAVDAGHGGEDPGAKGANGTREKDVTLAIARRLKEHIDRHDNMRAVLVRDGDYFIPLQDRVRKARRVQADLFVSIHADAFMKPTARGSSVFALSEKGATSAAARWLAKRENEADLIGGINLDVKDVFLKQTLLDLSQTATIADSLKLANAVLDELGEINALHKPHVEQAGFAVLKAPDIPSILVETAFISNPDEEKKLLDEAYQDRMAEAIITGIKRYFENNPPLARARMATNF